MTGFLLVTMYAAMVAAALAVEVLFGAAGLIPAEHGRRAQVEGFVLAGLGLLPDSACAQQTDDGS